MVAKRCTTKSRFSARCLPRSIAGLRSQCRRFSGGVGLLTTVGVDVEGGFFVRLRKSIRSYFYITLLSWEFLLKWYTSFEIYVETENSCWVPLFPLIASCYKIVNSQTSFTLQYVEESETGDGVGVGRRSRVWSRYRSRSGKFWKGRSWSRSFYLRLRNPDQ